MPEHIAVRAERGCGRVRDHWAEYRLRTALFRCRPCPDEERGAWRTRELLVWSAGLQPFQPSKFRPAGGRYCELAVRVYGGDGGSADESAGGIPGRGEFAEVCRDQGRGQ